MILIVLNDLEWINIVGTVWNSGLWGLNQGRLGYEFSIIPWNCYPRIIICVFLHSTIIIRPFRLLDESITDIRNYYSLTVQYLSLFWQLITILKRYFSTLYVFLINQVFIWLSFIYISERKIVNIFIRWLRFTKIILMDNKDRLCRCPLSMLLK
jgi:hypothetical protein